MRALAGLRMHWHDVSSAIHAGEVAIDLPPDVVEMGTDADPVRRLLLTKAMLELPSTHPVAILTDECQSAHRGKPRAEAAAAAHACRSRLAARHNLSLSDATLLLNATASFRSPLASRRELFSKPFVFNIECAALLCAYTRVLASEPPYGLAHRDFKRAAGHAAPFNSRRAIEDAFATLARRFAGLGRVSVVEFAAGNMYGPVPALAALAELGVKSVSLALVDKDYTEWLKKAEGHPAAAPGHGGGAGVGGGLPHAIDWGRVWKEWEGRVREAARPHAAGGVPLEDYLEVEPEPVSAESRSNSCSCAAASARRRSPCSSVALTSALTGSVSTSR